MQTRRTRFGDGARRGIALVEAIAAVIILAVSLATIMSLISQAQSSQTLGQQLRIAAALADERLNLVLISGPDDYGKTYAMEGACDAPFEQYRYRVNIQTQASSAAEVSVNISWPAGGGTKSIDVATRIAPRTVPTNQTDREPEAPVERNP